MLETRVTLLIALLACVAAAGCQSEAPALATNGQSASTGTASEPAGNGSSAKPVGSPAGNGAAGKTPKPGATGRARVAGRATLITFDDLELKMGEDAVFDPALLTPRVKELEGQRVRIRGFIYPSVFQQTGITQFPLVKNTECKFGPGGIAHHIIVVELKAGVSTAFTVRPIAVEGVLTVRPWTGPDGNTWTVYHLVGENVN